MKNEEPEPSFSLAFRPCNTFLLLLILLLLPERRIWRRAIFWWARTWCAKLVTLACRATWRTIRTTNPRAAWCPSAGLPPKRTSTRSTRAPPTCGASASRSTRSVVAEKNRGREERREEEEEEEKEADVGENNWQNCGYVSFSESLFSTSS